MAKEDRAIVQEVCSLLKSGSPDRALEILTKSGGRTSEARNARAVCLLRLGQAHKAVEIYRSLVLVKDSLFLRSDVPEAFKTNFATALLLEQNIAGCLSVLEEIRNETNPTVARLRVAIEQWRRSLSLPKRIMYALCGKVDSPPVTLDFPPGEIPDTPPERSAA